MTWTWGQYDDRVRDSSKEDVALEWKAKNKKSDDTIPRIAKVRRKKRGGRTKAEGTLSPPPLRVPSEEDSAI